ncbi:hypothetical protein, partial [Sphingomonas daechungensis]|uniref:hypothetical protein n=1 Tax=Sphingomonas daechungensis TaxID=1176646 RepID=UPI0037836244
MNVPRYSFATLCEVYPELESRTDRARVEVGDIQPLTADDLGLGALDPIRSVIDHPAGDDGSRDALRCAGDMLRDGRFTDEQIVGVLLNERNEVSAHIYRQDDPRRAALRVLSRVRGDSARDGQERSESHVAGSSAAEAGEGAQRPTFAILDPSEWAGKEVPPREYAIHGLFLASSLASLTGPG